MRRSTIESFIRQDRRGSGINTRSSATGQRVGGVLQAIRKWFFLFLFFFKFNYGNGVSASKTSVRNDQKPASNLVYGQLIKINSGRCGVQS